MQHDAHVVETYKASQFQPDGYRGTSREIPNLHLRTFNQLTEHLVGEGFTGDEASEIMVETYFGNDFPLGEGKTVFYDSDRGFQLREEEL